MEFLYPQDQMTTLTDAQAQCYLLCNGLGGYSSVTSAFSVPRADQGILISAIQAPNQRLNLVHRLQETLRIGSHRHDLSTQQFADNTPEENGWQFLESFSFAYVPRWEYQVGDVRITRQCVMDHEANTAALLYTIENTTEEICSLDAVPFFKFAPKEMALEQPKVLSMEGSTVSCEGHTLHIRTDGVLAKAEPLWQELAYPEDAKDGRPEKGLCGSCCRITFTALPGETLSYEIVFSDAPCDESASQILSRHNARMSSLEGAVPFTDPAALQLVLSADAYISRKDSTGGKTILAGYPLFSDWGRDTMIALPGCTLATNRFEDAKSILRTFLAYECDGLVPNLFPEGGCEPLYNTVDAALLLIDSVWHYYRRTNDKEFLAEAWPVMERIIAAYRRGTRHGIGMDSDGLIHAGQGLDQVTWMDVCVNGILPTPRHGKPVEINAYWYSALKVMETLSSELPLDGKDYGKLAETVKASFTEKFYMPDKGYLKDVLSGTNADTQLRCNQIWALTMPFTMLKPEQELSVLQAVETHLLTPCGLRTLSPEDPQYQGFYGGAQLQRDLAYHQGTTWVFPMGAYFRAYLKVHGNTPEAAFQVKQQLSCLQGMLRQGCAGQLPEIYDGDQPYEGKGCFAQAWSVGEMLRVYEAIYEIEHSEAYYET